MQRENQNHEKRDLPKRRSLRIGQILPRKSGSVRHSQFLVTRTFRPVPMVGRFPDFRVIATPRLLAFAMAQCGVTLRFTVTRSYRFFTCFPFTPCPARKAEQRHQPSIIQFYAIITEAVAKCNRNNSFPRFSEPGFPGLPGTVQIREAGPANRWYGRFGARSVPGHPNPAGWHRSDRRPNRRPRSAAGRSRHSSRRRGRHTPG